MSSAQSVSSLRKIRNASERTSSILKLVETSSNGLTRREIAGLIGVPINCVTGPIFNLIRDGHIAEVGTRFDSETQRNVAVLQAVPPELDVGL